MLAPSLVAAALAAFPVPPPNIVLFVADDMTWLDCGCYGSPDVRTPNIDRLAAEGIRFERMFTATAMCSPTRQQLFTGLFPVRNGAYPNHSKVKPGTRSLVHYLTDLGYEVGRCGKSHIGPEKSFPFEDLGGRGADTGEGEDMPFRRIEKFLGREREGPFCLVVTSHQPHEPWNRGDASAYSPDALTVPPYLIDTPETRDALSHYYAEITYMDGQVGRCLELLEEHEVADETLFIWTSEQGSSLPFAKWTCYELGLHTGFVARWPGKIPPGITLGALTQYVDVVPTLVEAAGGEVPDGLDGRSFLQGMLRGEGRHREHVFAVHTTRGIKSGSACYPIRSVRDERFKYIRNLNASEETFSNVLASDAETDPVLASWATAGADAARRARFYRERPEEELYDLEHDPFELTNLVGEDRHAERLDALRGVLDAWMLQQGDEGIATELSARKR